MLREAILKGADIIDARRAFDEGERAQYLNASEAMTCIRKQFYQKTGAEKDGPEDWGYARRGHNCERYMVECLKAANVPLLFAGEDQVGIVDEELRISCTPDGLCEGGYFDHDGVWFGAEFKSIDPRTNRANLPKEEHVRQLQISMALFEKFRDDFPELGDWPIKEGRLVYLDASNHNVIEEFRVPLKPKILDQLKTRARRVLDAKSASRLPREGKENGGRECKQRCSFNGVCGVDGAGSSTGQGHKGGGDAGVQVDAYLSAKERAADLKAAQDAAAEKLKAILKNNGVASMEVDGHTVKLSTRAGSVSYATVVKEHLPGVDLEPYRGNPSEVLTVK